MGSMAASVPALVADVRVVELPDPEPVFAARGEGDELQAARPTALARAIRAARDQERKPGDMARDATGSATAKNGT
jgi:hypothetical protein